MAVTSFLFLCFVAVAFLFYYLLPKKCQWVILLLASIAFYFYAMQSDPMWMLFIAVAAVISYLTALWTGSYHKKQKAELSDKTMDRAVKKEIKAKFQKKRRGALAVGVLSVLAMLVFLKYVNFFIGNINSAVSLFGGSFSMEKLDLVTVFGVSFYSFMILGYLIDVYRGKYEPQKNFFKYLLFVCYFPHITQGPISRYNDLAPQLYAERKFEYKNLKYGMQLMIWGFFKKLVIADRIAVFIDQVYGSYKEHHGLLLAIAACMYSIQIYCDFSGYVDIVSGASEIFGIKLAKNFLRPNFAKTVPEFWRRWHITLAEWFREYLFYPISVSKFSLWLNKTSRKFFGNTAGRIIASCFPVLVVWFTTGFWHGASWKFAAWGLYQGVLIMLGIIFGNLIVKLKKRLHIKTDCFSFRLFQMARTFLLCMVGRVFFRAASLTSALSIIKRIFTSVGTGEVLNGRIFTYGLDAQNFAVAMAGIFILLIVGILQEKFSIREKLEEQNLIFRWIIYLGALFAVIIFGHYGPGFTQAEFIYERF